MAKHKAFQVQKWSPRLKVWYLHREHGVSSWKLENAKAIAKRVYEDGEGKVRVRVRIKPTLEALWEKVLNRKKQTPQRKAIRKLAKKRDMTLTSGDRDYNTLAGVGRISDHWDKVETSWADDYWHPSERKMREFTAELQHEHRLKQVLFHDAGSGNHVHAAGYVPGPK